MEYIINFYENSLFVGRFFLFERELNERKLKMRGDDILTRLEIGRHGEELAREYLENAGYSILATNYRSPLGELDLVVKKDDTIVFVEVRTRSTPSFGTPLESIDRRKQERLIRLALQFCAHHCLYSKHLRFDVIGIYLQKNEAVIEHIPDAFYAGGKY